MTDRHRGRLTPDSPIEPATAELRPLSQDPPQVAPDDWRQYWPEDEGECSICLEVLSDCSCIDNLEPSPED